MKGYGVAAIVGLVAAAFGSHMGDNIYRTEPPICRKGKGPKGPGVVTYKRRRRTRMRIQRASRQRNRA